MHEKVGLQSIHIVRALTNTSAHPVFIVLNNIKMHLLEV